MIKQIGFFYDQADLIEWAYIIKRLEENGIDITNWSR